MDEDRVGVPKTTIRIHELAQQFDIWPRGNRPRIHWTIAGSDHALGKVRV